MRIALFVTCLADTMGDQPLGATAKEVAARSPVMRSLLAYDHYCLE